MSNKWDWSICLQKQKDIHSFKSIEYIRYNNMINIAKNVKGESENKLTTSKLIAYNEKMDTNNTIKCKSPKYPCLWICNIDTQIIDWICDWLTMIFQYESNEHRNKTWNQTLSHKTTKTTTPHSNNEITKKHKSKNLMYVKITYLEWKKEKRDAEGWF